MKRSQGGGDIHQLAGYYLHIKAVLLYGHIVVLSFVVVQQGYFTRGCLCAKRRFLRLIFL